MKLQDAHVAVVGGSTGIGCAAVQLAQARLLIHECITGTMVYIDVRSSLPVNREGR
jgi:NADPH:quinone reductase-like Zn-dependent oxidoreductase